MSISLYYTAKRIQPLSLQEQQICNEIAARYDEQYPFGELYEGFCIYDSSESQSDEEENIILDGSTKLPPEADQKLFFDILNWWLKCLEEIADALVGAQWHVHLDDMEFKWSEEKHEFLPEM